MEEVREEGTVYVHATGAKECAVGVCMCYRAVRGDLREGGVEGAGGTVGALPGAAGVLAVARFVAAPAPGGPPRY